MRTKPATKYSHEHQHAQYRIFNWFRNRGIKDTDVIKETVYVFCENNGYDMKFIKDETKTLNWVQNRFQKFSTFAVPYLKENNYLK